MFGAKTFIKTHGHQTLPSTNIMTKTKKPIKILAFDPGSRYLGVAVLENWELIYWGVKTFKNRTSPQLFLSEVRKVVSKLIGFYQPDIVAQEKISLPQSQSSEQLNKLFREIKKLAKQQGLAYGEYASNTVRKQICQNGRATKKETAKIIVSLYPELAINLTQDRAWKEKYWGHMFDAVAVGLCCRRKLK